MVDRDSSTYLVGFLQSYTKLMEEQLLNVRETMLATVEEVMRGAEKISSATEDKKQHAENALESTFLNPDVETEALIGDLQKVVSDVFEETSQKLEQGMKLETPTSLEPELLVQNRIKRLQARFQNEMQSLPQLDSEVSGLIFGIMGALSSEDVIAQKLDHIVMSMKALQTGLNYVLIDFEHRCNSSVLDHVISDIKSFTLRQYTCEDEKELFVRYLEAYKKSA